MYGHPSPKVHRSSSNSSNNTAKSHISYNNGRRPRSPRCSRPISDDGKPKYREYQREGKGRGPRWSMAAAAAAAEATATALSPAREAPVNAVSQSSWAVHSWSWSPVSSLQSSPSLSIPSPSPSGAPVSALPVPSRGPVPPSRSTSSSRCTTHTKCPQSRNRISDLCAVGGLLPVLWLAEPPKITPGQVSVDTGCLVLVERRLCLSSRPS
ncbi:hypothetical protein CCHR01_16380 [Colletotrichum chrysophilum]|uniref:Uncharacterized protein n=1 Tax=Colletotrichum chrysophilum TaxID=1836956 RepID=A0AAD9A8K0_9PEZI|nr:hypothetical protein CCHR01_16380 [Colletotrichum chrysophilum]